MIPRPQAPFRANFWAGDILREYLERIFFEFHSMNLLMLITIAEDIYFETVYSIIYHYI